MLNVFVGKLLNEKWYLPLLAPNFGPISKPNRLFASKAMGSFTEKIFNIVGDINQADFILLSVISEVSSISLLTPSAS